MSFTVVYLSETGVGQTIAERLRAEAGSHGLKCNAYAASEFATIAWSEPRVWVFISSSTGDGDPPEKAIKFWRWVRQAEQATLLAGSQVAMLGLGDSNYSTYMGLPRRLRQHVLAIGGSEFIPATEADDATPSGLESAVEPWFERLWPALAIATATKTAGAATASKEPQTHPRLAEAAFGVIPSFDTPAPSLREDDSIAATIVKAHYLSAPQAVKTVIHLSLEGGKQMPEYQPGDALYIRCPNAVEDVLFVLSRLSPSEQGTIECSKKGAEFWPAHVPRIAESFQVLSWYVDLGALPSKRLLRGLAQCCSESRDRQRLLDLCEISAKGKELYAELTAASAGLVAVLKQVPSCVPSMLVLINLLPVMRPRAYSVASAHFTNADRVDIVFTVFRRGAFAGACTTWLERLAKIGGRFLADRAAVAIPEELLVRQLKHWNNLAQVAVPIRFLAPTRFRLTEVLRVPVIMVAPGTGVAPFRAFCQHIEREKQKYSSAFPECHLFFGCRNRHHDFLFGDELEHFQKSNVLRGLHIAASREDPGNVVYVQHLVAHHGAFVADALLNRGGLMFVCGDAQSMAPAMEKTVLETFVQTGLTPEAATAALKAVKDANRYCVDVWA